MPSDAKILREQGPEALREFYRLRNNARRGVSLAPPPSECIDCHTPIQQSGGRRLRCSDCVAERHRADGRERQARNRQDPAWIERRREWERAHRSGPGSRSKHIIRTCLCGAEFELKRGESKRLYCKPTHRPRPGLSVRYASCITCKEPMTMHGNQSRCQNPDCVAEQYRIKMREYFRKNHKTAISYWVVDKTPEALALAETYFQFRQTIRRHRGNQA